jgi:hypothetical protein
MGKKEQRFTYEHPNHAEGLLMFFHYEQGHQMYPQIALQSRKHEMQREYLFLPTFAAVTRAVI